MCGRYWLFVSLFICGRESARMECYGDPQFVWHSGGWNGAFGGQCFFLHPQKRRKFPRVVISPFSMLF